MSNSPSILKFLLVVIIGCFSSLESARSETSTYVHPGANVEDTATNVNVVGATWLDTNVDHNGMQYSSENLIVNGQFDEWSERDVTVQHGFANFETRKELYFLPDGWTVYERAPNAVHPFQKLGLANPFHAAYDQKDNSALRLSGSEHIVESPMFAVSSERTYQLKIRVLQRKPAFNLQKSIPEIITSGDGLIKSQSVFDVLIRMFGDRERDLSVISSFQRRINLVDLNDERTGEWVDYFWLFEVEEDVNAAVLQLRPGFYHWHPDDSNIALLEVLVDDIELREVSKYPDTWTYDATTLKTMQSVGFASDANGVRTSDPMNLLVNGGFEKPLNEVKNGSGWDVAILPCPTCAETVPFSITRSDLRKHGTAALNIRPGSRDRHVSISQRVVVNQTGNYHISARVKSPTSQRSGPRGKAWIEVRSLCDGTDYRAYVRQNPNGWSTVGIDIPFTNYTCELRGERDAKYQFEVSLNVAGDTTFWFDDVRFDYGSRRAAISAMDSGIHQGASISSRPVPIGPAKGVGIEVAANDPQHAFQFQVRFGYSDDPTDDTWSEWRETSSEVIDQHKIDVVGVPAFVQWRAKVLPNRWVTSEEEHAKRFQVLDGLSAWKIENDTNDVTKLSATVDLRGYEGAYNHVYLIIPHQPGLCLDVRVNTIAVEQKLCGAGEFPWQQIEHLLKENGSNTLEVSVTGANQAWLDRLDENYIRLDMSSQTAHQRTTNSMIKSVVLHVDGAERQNGHLNRILNYSWPQPITKRRYYNPLPYGKIEQYIDSFGVFEDIVARATDGLSDEDAIVARLSDLIYEISPSFAVSSPSAYNLIQKKGYTWAEALKLAQKIELGFACSHFWISYSGLFLAAGIEVRQVNGIEFNEFYYWGENSMEYWSNKHNKWVFLDPTTNLRFYYNDLPLSIGEVIDYIHHDNAGEMTTSNLSARGSQLIDIALFPVGPYATRGPSPAHSHANSYGWAWVIQIGSGIVSGEAAYYIPSGMEPIFFSVSGFQAHMPKYTHIRKTLYPAINQTTLRAEFEKDALKFAVSSDMRGFKYFEFKVNSGDWVTLTNTGLSQSFSSILARAKALVRYTLERAGLADPQPEASSNTSVDNVRSESGNVDLETGENVFRVRAVNERGRPGPITQLQLVVN